MTNKKQTATKIQKGYYDYKGWRITDHKGTKGWSAVDFSTGASFEGFLTFRDAKNQIDKII